MNYYSAPEQLKVVSIVETLQMRAGKLELPDGWLKYIDNKNNIEIFKLFDFKKLGIVSVIMLLPKGGGEGQQL